MMLVFEYLQVPPFPPGIQHLPGLSYTEAFPEELHYAWGLWLLPLLLGLAGNLITLFIPKSRSTSHYRHQAGLISTLGGGM